LRHVALEIVGVVIITSKQVATLSVRFIFAIVSACGLYIRPFGPQLGLRLWYAALA